MVVLTIITISDALWDEIKKMLPREKPPKTVGRPTVKYRKVLDGVLYVWRTGRVSVENGSQRIRFRFNMP